MIVRYRVWLVTLGLLSLASFHVTALAQGARPIIDLQPGTYPEASRPSQYVSVGERTFFMAERYGEGRELWVTDGTSQGTRLVKDIAPGAAGSMLDAATALDDELLFVANDGGHGFELWSSDGTADGTALMADINPGPASGVFAKQLPTLDGFAYFIAYDGTNPYALWRTSGANGVTELFYAPGFADRSYFVGRFDVSNGHLFFVEGNFHKQGASIYASDGTRGTAVRLLDEATLGVGQNADFITFQNETWFSATRGGIAQLWRSDGSAQGTRPLASLPDALHETRLKVVAAQSDYLYFTSYSFALGTDLWRTDGTNTQRVADLFPGVAGHAVRAAASTPLGDYFLLSSGTAQSLWFVRASDGVFVRVQQPDDVTVQQRTLTTSNNDLYFVASQTSRANNVWAVTQDATSMHRLTDFMPGTYRGVASGGARKILHDGGGYLLFSADTDGSGDELWRSELTPGSTRLVADIQPDRGISGGIGSLISLDDQLVFTGPSQLGGTGIWRSNGSAQSTERFLDFGAYEDCDWPSVKKRPFVHGFTKLDGRLIFTAGYYSACPARGETWVTDGSNEGSEIILPFELYETRPLGNRVFGFAGDTSDPWITDGTKDGSHRLGDLDLDLYWSVGLLSDAFHGKIYFGLYDFFDGTEIWQSDGTPQGTMPVADVDPALSAGIRVSVLGQTSEAVYWMVKQPASQYEIWRIDAQGSITRVAQLGRAGGQYFQFSPGTAIGDRLVFNFHGDYGMEAWVTDGTAPGTRQVLDIGPGNTGANGEEPFGFLKLNDQLYFRANDGVHGTELWRTDGTPKGTRMVRDLLPGALGSLRYFLRIDEEAIYLSARTASTGEELWRFDGQDFTQLTEILPGSQGVQTSSLKEADGKLYFTVDDGIIGQELWVLDESVPLHSDSHWSRSTERISPIAK